MTISEIICHDENEIRSFRLDLTPAEKHGHRQDQQSKTSWVSPNHDLPPFGPSTSALSRLDNFVLIGSLRLPSPPTDVHPFYPSVASRHINFQ
jgi:hypothetical protein